MHCENIKLFFFVSLNSHVWTFLQIHTAVLWPVKRTLFFCKHGDKFCHHNWRIILIVFRVFSRVWSINFSWFSFQQLFRTACIHFALISFPYWVAFLYSWIELSMFSQHIWKKHNQNNEIAHGQKKYVKNFLLNSAKFEWQLFLYFH